MGDDRKDGEDGKGAADRAGGAGSGNSLEDASKEAVREIERRDGEGHAGTGDIG